LVGIIKKVFNLWNWAWKWMRFIRSDLE